MVPESDIFKVFLDFITSFNSVCCVLLYLLHLDFNCNFRDYLWWCSPQLLVCKIYLENKEKSDATFSFISTCSIPPIPHSTQVCIQNMSFCCPQSPRMLLKIRFIHFIDSPRSDCWTLIITGEDEGIFSALY